MLRNRSKINEVKTVTR